jgi:hypothetical protein
VLSGMRYSILLSLFNPFFFVPDGKKLSDVTILCPVLLSSSFLAFLATAPPFLPAMAFC